MRLFGIVCRSQLNQLPGFKPSKTLTARGMGHT